MVICYGLSNIKTPSPLHSAYVGILYVVTSKSFINVIMFKFVGAIHRSCILALPQESADYVWELKYYWHTEQVKTLSFICLSANKWRQPFQTWMKCSCTHTPTHTTTNKSKQLGLINNSLQYIKVYPTRYDNAFTMQFGILSTLA